MDRTRDCAAHGISVSAVLTSELVSTLATL